MKKELKVVKNLIKGTFQIAASKTIGRPPKLYGLFFEVTDACNSRCKHCDIWRQKPTPNPLTVKEVERIFQNPFFKDLKEVIISGGEPVLRPDLAELIITMSKHIRPDALISLSTNGLLPERVIKTTKAMVENKINTIVGVSLDGIGEKHDGIRGVKGNFEKVDFLLHQLIDLKEKHKDKLLITVGFTLSPLTVDSMEDVRAYTENLGFHFLPQVYEEASFYNNKDNIGTTPNEKLTKAIQKLPPSFQKEVMLRASMGRELKFNCSSMDTFFALHCNGEISPCLRYNHLKLGNLRQQSIEELWQSEKIKRARKKIKNCNECYNGWVTGWSMIAWFFPFLPTLIGVYLEKRKGK